MKNYTQTTEGFIRAIQEKQVHQFNYKDYKEFNFYQKFIKQDSPLNILSSDKHSLQPDMLFGWKPKLPSCPCPLKFPNQTVDSLIPLVKMDDRYKIAYIGKRPVNSIQINQQYTYNWRYRQRYSLNIALVDEAYKQNQGNTMNNLLQQQRKCQYEFDSNFQSGNLDLAIRIKPNQYDCYIRSDSNTRGHCNWYYFKVSNHERVGEVQFNICNIGKIKNLYNKGMKPYVLQIKTNDSSTQQNWNQNLCYDVQFVQRLSRFQKDKKSFQLQFKYNFKQPNSSILVAYGIPYTYSKLQNFIKQISETHESIVQIQKLCESLGGVNVPLIKITNEQMNQQRQFQPMKKAVIVTARIHPGQSHSSFLLQGFVKQLLQEKSSLLRQMFVFYIIPMLNPDGVIVGNYRTSYSGKDLNRQFQNLQKYIFPQIFYLNDLVAEIRKKHFKGIQFFFDFHGHSSKKNMFTYGPDHSPQNPYFLKSRIFAKLLQQITPVFSYKKSIFTISEGKKKTGRAHMIRKLKIPMVYTFQISNGMYEVKNKQNILLDQKILINCGNSILKGLFKYARVQMRIPSYLIKPKVDTGVNKKRIIKSSKQIRTAIIKKRKPSANFQNEIKIRQSIKSAKIFSKEQVNDKIIQNHCLNQNQEQQKNQSQSSRDFLKMIQNIEIFNNQNQSQGGSDSQSDEEDLSKEETNKLFNQIALKKNEALKSQKQQKRKKVKITVKRQKMMTENSKDFLNQIKIQMKKDKNQQLLDIINERNKIKEINSTKNIPLKKLKSPERVIFRDRSNFANFQTNKDILIQKVPIAQKNFNLQIDYQRA